MKAIKTMSLDLDVLERIEDLRKGRAHFYSGFVNSVLRKEFGLPEKGIKR
jgi:hypothetical protein